MEDKQEDTPQVETEPTEQKPEAERTFTQEEVNKLMGDVRKKTRSQYEDYDALKAKANKFDEIEAQNLSELEKAQKEIENLKAKADAAEASRQATERKSQIVSEATKLNFSDPLDAVALVGDAEDIEAALKELAETKPYLLRHDKRTAPKIDPRNPGPVEATETYAEKRARIYGLGEKSTFDPREAEKRGGGVFYPPKGE